VLTITIRQISDPPQDTAHKVANPTPNKNKNKTKEKNKNETNNHKRIIHRNFNYPLFYPI
jgi:hypothetical protein